MLRDYQKMLAEKAKEILEALGIVYLVFEMRVGKTRVSMRAAELLNCKNVLFVTKKKPIASIQGDYEVEGFNFQIHITNYEQLGKRKIVEGKHGRKAIWENKLMPYYDMVIVDEAHSLGSYPKPALRTQLLQKLVGYNYLVLLSGTPTPESYSQLYHQFNLSLRSPFKQWGNFYKWAHEFVDIKHKMFNGLKVNDYKNADKEKIMPYVEPYMLRYTQREAGFKQCEVVEKIIPVKINKYIPVLVERLIKERIYQFKDGSHCIADSAVKLQNKIHQLYSGTIITDEKTSKILDFSKAEYIRDNYRFCKIAVFYKFVAEGEALRQILDNITTDPEEFNKSSDKIFISQVQSGAMGINLSSARVLIFYNIDFSALNYWQARDRIKSLDRTEPVEVHWLFSDVPDGIEHKIYKAVLKKKSYTVSYFKRHYLQTDLELKRAM